MAFYVHLPNGLTVDPHDVVSVTADYEEDGEGKVFLAYTRVWTTYERDAPTWSFTGEEAQQVADTMEDMGIEVLG